MLSGQFMLGLVLLIVSCFFPPIARKVQSKEIRAYLCVIDAILTVGGLALMIAAIGTVWGAIWIGLAYLSLSAIYFGVVYDDDYVNPYTWKKKSDA